MSLLSPQLEEEIVRRVAEGSWDSPDELVRSAFAALDRKDGFDDDWLESELLKGLEGEDVEMDSDDWANIRRQGSALYEAAKRS